MEELTGGVFLWALGGVVAIAIYAGILTVIRTAIQVCPPNHIMVIQGPKSRVGGRQYGFRIVRGGRALILPLLHRAELLDLSIRPIRLHVENVTSANGITLNGEMTAAVCVNAREDGLLYSAVERMLGRTADEIAEQVTQTMVGNFRAALSQATPLEVVGMSRSIDFEVEQTGRDATKKLLGDNVTFDDEAEPEGGESGGSGRPGTTDRFNNGERGERAAFRDNLIEHLNDDLSSFGMSVVSVSVKSVLDTSNYLSNLASRSVAMQQRVIEMEEDRLRSWANAEESKSERRQQVAKNKTEERISAARRKLGLADEDRKARVRQAELEAEARIAEARSKNRIEVARLHNDLQEQRNYTEVTAKADFDRRAAEIVGTGRAEAAEIRQNAHNDLTREKAKLLTECPRSGATVLFVEEQLEGLLNSYIENAKGMDLDRIVGVEGMSPEELVNRGPKSLAKFLGSLDEAFGIDVKHVIGTARPDREKEGES